MNTEPTQLKTQPSAHFLAILSLVLSILGLLPILPLVGSIAGIVTGVTARKEIRTQPEKYSGEGTAKAGIILGWIGVGLAAVAAIGIVLVVLFLTPVRTSGGTETIITIVPVIP